MYKWIALCLLAILQSGCALTSQSNSGQSYLGNGSTSVLPSGPNCENGICADENVPMSLNTARLSVSLSNFSSLTDLDGISHSLGQATKPLVLIFWQAWCAPCKKKGPKLAKLAAAHPELQFYGVVSGSDEDVEVYKVKTLARKWQLPYPQLRDKTGALSDGLGVKGTPTIIVLSPMGQILYNEHALPSIWKF